MQISSRPEESLTGVMKSFRSSAERMRLIPCYDRDLVRGIVAQNCNLMGIRLGGQMPYIGIAVRFWTFGITLLNTD